MSKTTKKLSARKAMEMCPHAVAKHFGIHYNGDVNPFDHGGYFYSHAEWLDSGYADCVEIWQYPDDDLTVVEEGTINHAGSDMESAWATHGIAPEDGDTRNNLLAEIEVCRDYGGIEPLFTNSTSSTWSFTESQELQMWRRLLPILERMGQP